MFWRPKKYISFEPNEEVLEMKKKVKQSSVQAKDDIDRLNKLLKANGITFRIHIASAGHHGE